jgi:dihydrofolate reductase
MRRIFLFMNVSLDGFFETPEHDLSWAGHDYEAFSTGSSQVVDTILLGRQTYEMMKAFWPTPQAAQMAPEIAGFMNDRLKIVASRQPFDPGWKNVAVFSGDVVEQVRRFKQQPGGDAIMMGSNTLCVSLMQAGLVDEFQLVLNPVALGRGTPLFKGLTEVATFKLVEARPFKSGAVLLTYRSER